MEGDALILVKVSSFSIPHMILLRQYQLRYTAHHNSAPAAIIIVAVIV
jgi:hypothetical protein